MNFVPLHTWLKNTQEPLLIAGPCGAETEAQVLKTAEQLSKIPQVALFRSGIWKPRTRPNSFEGMGEQALVWLQQVKKQFGLKTTVEVATAHHVELALKYQVDVLWIGARTTVNPFSVQEIADCLKGIDIPVMIKNPIHPDLQLWIGAIERINLAGIDKIAAIHRGFHHYGQHKYRNEPIWKLPIELRTLYPQLPVICDPSHIAGNLDLIQEVAQEALNIGFNGLMIESHCAPDKALSDAKQQLKPANLEDLILNLKIRTDKSSDAEAKLYLSDLRKLIDSIDEELMDVIRKREEVIRLIGKYKKDHNVTAFQLERWQEILRTRAQWADKRHISRSHIEKLCQLLHEESIRIQNELLD
jgi:chorismate mutase